MTLGPLGLPSQHVLSSAASGPTASVPARLSAMHEACPGLSQAHVPHTTKSPSSEARKAGWSAGRAAPGSYWGAPLSFEGPAQTGRSAALDWACGEDLLSSLPGPRAPGLLCRLGSAAPPLWASVVLSVQVALCLFCSNTSPGRHSLKPSGSFPCSVTPPT